MKKTQNIYLSILSLLLVYLVVFTSCGTTVNTAEEPAIAESIDYEALYKEEPINDVLKDNWVKEDVSDAKTFMSLAEYHSNIFKANDSGKRFSWGYFADTGYMYSLEQYYSEERGKTSVFLNKLNMSDKTVSVVDYTETMLNVLSDPYAINGNVFASEAKWNDDDNELTEYRMVELLPDGTVSEKANVVETLKKYDWYPEPNTLPNLKLIYEPTSGNTYILTNEGDCLIVTDENGAETTCFTGFENSATLKISDFSCTEDGHVLFMCAEGAKENIFIFEEDEPKILYSGKTGFEANSSLRTIDSHGRLLYSYGSEHNTIVSWDIKTGAQEKIYTEDNNNHLYYIDCFARNDKGELLVLCDNNLRVLSLAGAASEIEITLEPITFVGYQLKTCIARYERTHPGVKFIVGKEPSVTTRDTKFNQMYTDIIGGNGPDLILLYDEYLGALAENGCLYELSGVLREDIKEKLLPAVYNAGFVGDSKYMMEREPNIKTFIINKKYSSKASWTITDILNIVEEREKEGNPFERLIVGPAYEGNPLWLLLYNVCESEFVDTDNHTCDFDSETFVKLLNLCKKEADKNAKGMGSSENLMKQDRALIYNDYLMSLLEYSEDFAKLGEEEFRTIGYPATSGNGYILSFAEGISVNRNAVTDNPEKKMVIEDFLNCLYTPEYLVETIVQTVPTRTDMFDGRICLPSEYEWMDTPQIRLAGGRYALIAGKKDGTSYVDEYLELLTSCESRRVTDVDSEKILNIIDDETAPFFAGEKSAEEVAKIIQARVKLYLEERK